MYERKLDLSKVKKRIVVCLEEKIRVTEDGIEILPYREFIRRLWGHPLKADVELSFASDSDQ